MKHFKNLDELLTHWGQQADKYEALIRLREDYEERRRIIEEPYLQKLLAHAERHGAASVTPEIRDSLYGEVRDDMRGLREEYGQMMKEISDRFDRAASQARPSVQSSPGRKRTFTRKSQNGLT
jgi:ElaB/YqjD/DUF883 family membrane-anchored ribosome-binding protein